MFGASVVEAYDAGHGYIKCLSPPFSTTAGGSVSLEVSYNGQDFTNHGVQFMYDPTLQVSAVTPAWGPVSGHTRVRVVGQNFRNHPTDQLKCRFGDQEVAATWHNGREVGCSSPRLGDIDEIQTVTMSSLAPTAAPGAPAYVAYLTTQDSDVMWLMIGAVSNSPPDSNPLHRPVVTL